MQHKTFGKRFLSAALVLVMVFGLFGAQVTAAEPTDAERDILNTSITVEGKANAIILLPQDASDQEQLAAKELQDHVELVSGAWLPIGTQGNDNTPLAFFWKEEKIVANEMGYYPIRLFLHNTTDQTMNLTLQQANAQEGKPQVLFRGETDTDDTFLGEVTLDAGKWTIVSGLLAVTEVGLMQTTPIMINAMNGDELVEQIPLNVYVNTAYSYIGNTTFNTDDNWMLDDGSALDQTQGYQDDNSLKITEAAQPAYTPGVNMTAGRLYRLRFWAKSDAAGGTIQAVVSDRGGDDAEKNKSLYTTKDISGDWQEYNYYFVANSGLVQDYVFSRIFLNCTGNLWIDDLSLVDCGTTSSKLPYGDFEYDPNNKPSNNYWSASLTSEQKHSGNQSAKIGVAANKSGFVQWSLGMLKAESEVNVPYTISFWAKAQADGTLLNLTMSRSDMTTPLHTFVLSDEWEHYELDYYPEAVDATGNGSIFRLTLPAGTSAQTVWVDDVLFLPTTAPGTVATPEAVEGGTMPVLPAVDVPQILHLSIEIATADAANTQLRALFPEEVTYLETLTGPEGRKYGSDGFAIQKVDNTVYIFGTEDRGTLNGVYDFIEYNADVLWYRAGKVAYQENPTIQLKKYDCCEKSPFSVRGWNAVGMGDTGLNNVDTDFDTQQSRNKMNVMYIPNYSSNTSVVEATSKLGEIGLGTYLNGHNLGRWILTSPSYPGHTEGEELPEESKIYWNQNADGVYMTSQTFGSDTYAQINVWDPNGIVSDCMVDSVIAYVGQIRERGLDLDQVGIGMNDTYTMPQLGYDDQPFEYAPGQFVQPGDENYLSTVSFTFFNTMAQKLRDRGYDIKLNIFAYLFLNEPPACEIDENLSILYAPLQESPRFPLNMNEGDYPGFDSSKNIMYHRQIETWDEKSDDVVVYTYYGCYAASKQFERSIGKKMQADMQYFAEKGFRGVLPEGTIDNGTDDSSWTQNTLTFWLYSKLMWNPYADLNELIQEFCTKVYGVAAQEMIRYYQLRELAWDNNSESDFSHSTDIYRLLTFALMRSGYVTPMQISVNDAWKKLNAAGEAGEIGREVLEPIRELFNQQAATYSRYDYAGWPDTLPSASVVLNTGNPVTLSISQTSTAVYATTDANGVATLVTGEAPVDNYVMLTYDDRGVPTLYLKSATLAGNGYYGVIEMSSTVNNVVVVEDSSITATESATNNNNVGIGNRSTSGDVVVIDGPGKLTIVSGNSGIRAYGSGNVIIEQAANIEFVRGAGWGISAPSGTVTVMGDITINTGTGNAIITTNFVLESGDVTIHHPTYNANNKSIQATHTTVNGGNLSITASSASGSYAINSTTVTLNGGHVYTNTGRGIVASGEVVINGGVHNFENNFSAAVITVQGSSITINGGEVTMTAHAGTAAKLTSTAITLPDTGYVAVLGTSRDGSGALVVTGTADTSNTQYCYFSITKSVN